MKNLSKIMWLIKDRIYLLFFYTVRFVEITYEKIHSRFYQIENHKVVFDNFHGKGYGDNPKYIADEILRQRLDWDLVWLANDIKTPVPQGIRVVREGTGKAIWERATAKVWVDNTRNVVRPHKRKGQICLQTWHGGLNFKYVEGAVEDKLVKKYVRLAKEDGKNCDGIISGCGLRSEEYRKYFWLGEHAQILEFGLPRNDVLFRTDAIQETYRSVRQKYGLRENQKILLYMPTFRDDHSLEGYALDYNRVIMAMERRFGEDFVIVVRLHPGVHFLADRIQYSHKIINGTPYLDAQELYMAADFLITDYSSSAFDFALLGKPVFLCMLDYENYLKMRGVTQVFSLCPFPHTYSNDELVDAIESFSYDIYEQRMAEFKTLWKPFDDGHAAERTVKWLREMIQTQ